MDGYVLPSFESTSILKDKDIVGLVNDTPSLGTNFSDHSEEGVVNSVFLCYRVKKKQGTSRDTAKLRDVENALEEIEFVEKQPVHTGLKLIANEEFEKETGGYESESEEDACGQSHGSLNEEDASNSNAVSKKRKASKKLVGSKYVLNPIYGIIFKNVYFLSYNLFLHPVKVQTFAPR